MQRSMIVLLSAATLMLSGCASHSGTGGNTAPPNTPRTTIQVARTWHVGNFTISTHLLPKLYDPNGSWNFMTLTPTALYYVPKSKPTELVAQPLPNGPLQTVADLGCTTDGLPQNSVWPATGAYLLVQCGWPPSGKSLQGILVDAKTGHTWTLWTNGGVDPNDGTLSGWALVSKGWVYFKTFTIKRSLEEAMNLSTGVTKPIPSVFGGMISPSVPYVAPDGTLYVVKPTGTGPNAFQKPFDLYRVNGIKTTLVAQIPGTPTNDSGVGSFLSVDANGTISVSRPGGTLTSNAGSMTIQVVNNEKIPAPPGSKLIRRSNEYVASLGPAPSPGAKRPVQITVETSGGLRTIVVGEVPNQQYYADTVSATPYDDYPTYSVVFFPAPNGRWQIVTVSRDSSP